MHFVRSIVGLLCLSRVSNAVLKGVITDPVAFSAVQFDYVVIGGGTAGLVVAARLAENPYIKVGVIEAGLFRPNDELIDTPLLFGHAIGNLSYDWGFSTVPQPAVDNRNVYCPRGKALGGSSALNFMAYHRASSADYKAWFDLGNNGWNWLDLIPFFKKAETYKPPSASNPDQIFPGTGPAEETIAANGLNKYEGFSGPIQATFNVFYGDVNDPFILSMNNVGIPTNRNPDYGDATGVWNSPAAINRSTGKRSYTTQYYVKDGPKTNLIILTGAQATKVIFKSEKVNGNLVASKVQYSVSGNLYTVSATREIILSAGAFQTPQLLELSGIGKSSLLTSLGIPVLLDLPQVGENLQDHIYIPQDWQVKPGHHTFDELRNNATFAAEQLAKYNGPSHDGIYASNMGPFAFFPLEKAASPATVAGIKSRLDADLAAHPPTSPFIQAQFNIQRQWLETTIGNLEVVFLPGSFATKNPAPGTSYVSMVTTLQHAFSRGTVHINSANPLTPPSIDPQYLSRNYDLECLRTAFKLGVKVASTPPFSDLLVQMSVPDPSTVQTDAQIDAYIRANMQPVYHPIGTAAMAPRNIGGVVSPELLVYGTKNLRVVDASVIPIHIAAHPQQSIIALGEKAANIIANCAN